MTLAELIKARGITAQQGADEIGLSTVDMLDFMNGRRTPHLDQAIRIFEWSGGLTTLRELVAVSDETETMTLAEFLKARGITARQGAEELGISDSEMSRFVKRRREPGIRLADKIIAWSGGLVTLSELMVLERTPQEPPVPMSPAA